MLVFAIELQRRALEHRWNLLSVAAHPGWSRTDIVFNGPGQGAPGLKEKLMGFTFNTLAQSARDGALPSLFAAMSAQGQGRRLLRSRRPWRDTRPGGNRPDHAPGRRPGGGDAPVDAVGAADRHQFRELTLFSGICAEAERFEPCIVSPCSRPVSSSLICLLFWISRFSSSK